MHPLQGRHSTSRPAHPQGGSLRRPQHPFDVTARLKAVPVLQALVQLNGLCAVRDVPPFSFVQPLLLLAQARPASSLPVAWHLALPVLRSICVNTAYWLELRQRYAPDD